MPSAPQPKYRATKPFSCAGQHFNEGDVVPDSPALAAALQFGSEFVTTERAQKAEKE